MFPLSSFVKNNLIICDCKPLSIPSILLNFFTIPFSSSKNSESYSHINPKTGVILKTFFHTLDIIGQKSKYIGLRFEPIIA